jgi:hypothetical protein
MLNALFDSRIVAPWIRVAARLCSLGVVVQFLIILAALIANEDPVPPEGRPVVIGVALAILGAVMAWRWQRLGAALLLLSTGVLVVAAAASALIFDMGWLGLVLAWLIYPMLPFAAGILSLVSVRFPARA